MNQAIFINAEERKLEYVTLSNDYHEIYPFIGPHCRTFSCPITFDNQDSIYVDDEGLYMGYEHGFIMDGWDYPILGNGLILGANEEGDSVSVKSTIEELQNKFQFITL